MTMTYHCEVERAERVEKILTKIGIGQIVREKFYRGCYTCITDTGVTIVKSADKQTIITMYITTYSELVAVFAGEKKIPTYLKKKVNHNQSKYTNHGKTIWA